MASINKTAYNNHLTYNMAPAKRIDYTAELMRSVSSCLLWENEFYENGETISNRIAKLVPLVRAELVKNIAISARTNMNLRHVPLWIITNMVKIQSHRHLVAETIYHVIQRPDELTELLSIYWKDGKIPIASQIKKGLAQAFTKFDEYQLAKWNKSKEIKLRDVMRLVHPIPKNKEQSELWNRLQNNNLKTPNTWEVNLSSGNNKRLVWEKMLTTNTLPALALLRNFRNMINVGVDLNLIKNAISSMNTKRVLPFRFISAVKFAPMLEEVIEQAMLKSLTNVTKIPGHTVLLVDVSGSMSQRLSNKSSLSRLDAACGLAILLRETCEKIDILTFSRKLVQVPARHGFALSDVITKSQPHLATFLGAAVKAVYSGDVVTANRGGVKFKGFGFNIDRLIVISDEQSNDVVPTPKSRGYMINVASCKNGVGYGSWTHCDGWSETVVSWISSLEQKI